MEYPKLVGEVREYVWCILACFLDMDEGEPSFGMVMEKACC